jgi:recombination protein RecT
MNTQVATQQKQGLTVWEGFQAELKSREQEICAMLPSHINKERFKNSIIAAVKQTPDLLKATPRSFFGALTKSAQDGLLPDGREGVVTVYGKEAQWNPMAHGLRKRARELDQIIVDAQVVYQNDVFDWHQGDEPRIEHDPAPLGTPRGEMIGAYAVFRNKSGILHREVMDASQIAKVKSQSKNPDGLLWGKFEAEAWRKTVVRRGFKTVPVSEKLAVIVQRDDDNYQFDQPQLENAPARPERVAYQPTPPAQGEDFDKRYSQTMAGETESASGEPEALEAEEEATAEQGRGRGPEETPGDGSTPAPEREAADSAGQQRPFLEDRRAILYDGAGKEINSYERAGNFFKAVMAQIPKEDNPRAFVEANARAANHFVNKDEALMDLWDECAKAATDAEAARDSVA